MLSAQRGLIRALGVLHYPGGFMSNDKALELLKQIQKALDEYQNEAQNYLLACCLYNFCSRPYRRLYMVFPKIYLEVSIHGRRF